VARWLLALSRPPIWVLGRAWLAVLAQRALRERLRLRGGRAGAPAAAVSSGYGRTRLRARRRAGARGRTRGRRSAPGSPRLASGRRVMRTGCASARSELLLLRRGRVRFHVPPSRAMRARLLVRALSSIQGPRAIECFGSARRSAIRARPHLRRAEPQCLAGYSARSHRAPVSSRKLAGFDHRAPQLQGCGPAPDGSRFRYRAAPMSIVHRWKAGRGAAGAAESE
jgi:hypothetical protein